MGELLKTTYVRSTLVINVTMTNFQTSEKIY